MAFLCGGVLGVKDIDSAPGLDMVSRYLCMDFALLVMDHVGLKP